MTQGEFEALLNDLTKRIDGSIIWEQSDKSGYRFDFRVKVTNEASDALTIKGSHNRILGKTSYTLFTNERIFAVDYDRTHGDAGSFHVHRFDATTNKAEAHEADAAPAVGQDPIRLWRWFCTQAGIKHKGELEPIPHVQRDLFESGVNHGSTNTV